MNSFFVNLRVIGVALGLATMLSLASVFVERTGPELVEFSNLCGKTHSDPCYRPVLKGGFPVAYLFDAAGISVENKLSFGEDNVAISALSTDIAIYFMVFCILRLALQACRQSVIGKPRRPLK